MQQFETNTNNSTASGMTSLENFKYQIEFSINIFYKI